MEQAKRPDMSEGSVKRLIVKMALPAVLAQVVNLLYNIVDRIYIGHMPEVGGNALTGVGLFTPILMLITAFAMLCGSGGAPNVGIALGEGNKEKAEKIMGNCFTLLIRLSVVLTAAFYFLAPTLLDFFGGSENTLPYAIEYAKVYILGSIFVLIVMGMNMFISAQGNAKVAMITTLIGAVINIVLDPIFIFLFDMGVTGAALATVISQAVSALWILKFLTSEKSTIRLKRENLRLEKNIVLPCLALGISTFVMVSTESVLSVCFSSSLSEYGGDLAVGAMTILTSINQLITMPLSGICQGVNPIISYNFGARKLDRVKEAFKTQLIVCVSYASVFCILLMLFPSLFAGIFTDDALYVDFTAWAIRIFFCGVFSVGFQLTCQQTFIALGKAKISLFLACLRKIILLIPLIFILPTFIANQTFAVFLAEPVSDIIAATVTTAMFFYTFKKMLKQASDISEPTPVTAAFSEDTTSQDELEYSDTYPMERTASPDCDIASNDLNE